MNSFLVPWIKLSQDIKERFLERSGAWRAMTTSLNVCMDVRGPYCDGPWTAMACPDTYSAGERQMGRWTCKSRDLVGKDINVRPLSPQPLHPLFYLSLTPLLAGAHHDAHRWCYHPPPLVHSVPVTMKPWDGQRR